MADLQGLHEKLNRKKTVESTNDDLVVNFCSSFKQKLCTLDQEFHTCAEDQIHFYQGLYTQLGEGLEKREEELKALGESFSSMVGSQMCQCEEWSKSEDIHVEYSNGWIAEHRNISDQFKDSTISRQDVFQNDKFHPMIGTIASHLQNQAQQLNNTRTMIAAKISEGEQKLAEFISSYKCKISEMESFVSSTADKEMANLESSQKQVSDIKEAEDLLIAKMRHFQESLGCIIQARESIKKNSTKQLQNSLSKSAVRQKERKREALGLTTEMNKDLDIFQSEGKNLHQVYATDIQDCTNQALTCNNAIEKKIEELSSEVNDFNIQTQATLDQHHNTVETSLHKLSSVCTQHQDTEKNRMQKLKSSLQNSIEVHEAVLKEQQDTFQSATEEIRKELTLKSSEISEAMSHLSWEIQEKSEDLEKFFKEEMKRDIPRTTPVRRDYEYPRQLVATSPHEVLIERYRKLGIPFKADSIPLPDDSDLEIELSQPEFELSQPELFKASSQSDISITSDASDRAELENKENGSLEQSVAVQKHSKRKTRTQAKEKPLALQNQKIQ